MTLATLWRTRVEASAIVVTKCDTCGCEHPRRMAVLKQRPHHNGYFIVPCIKCTNDSQSSIPHYTRQRIVEMSTG